MEPLSSASTFRHNNEIRRAVPLSRLNLDLQPLLELEIEHAKEGKTTQASHE